MSATDNSEVASGEQFQSGCFVAVVGPSGAGKDTLINSVRAQYADDPQFVFARRIITRQGDGSEDHDCVTLQEFEAMKANGAFLLSWSANNLSYGIPALLADDLSAGRVVIANVSRTVLDEIRQRFRFQKTVHVTASADVLAQRLGARGREDLAGQQARLARAVQQDLNVHADVTIDNSGQIEASVQAFGQVLNQLGSSQPHEN